MINICTKKLLILLGVLIQLSVSISTGYTQTNVIKSCLGNNQSAIYISEMSKCQPVSALSNKLEKACWTLIPYTTEEVSGNLACALSFINAPEMTLPLKVTGWYAVYVGYWNPFFVYDEGTTVRIKLSGDQAFCRIKEPAICVSQKETAIQEVFFKYADLTGQDFVFGKINGPLATKALIAYVKLVPLSESQVTEIRNDRTNTSTRRLVATHDGGIFWSNEYLNKQHIMEVVERYRYSDVKKVLWAVNYGDVANYPSKVALFWTESADRASLVEGTGTTQYIRGQKAMYDTYIDLVTSKGIIPQDVIARHVHEMGVKFDIMFRLGIIGGIPPHRNESNFVARHPEFRQLTRDGIPVEKASYAFREVRDFMLSLIAEATRKFDVDGINLCFVRGPHFVSYEKPVLDDFYLKYKEDARKVDSNDPRLHAIRAKYMTEFVQEARKLLDIIGKEKSKSLELSVWGWPGGQNVWCGKTTAEEGLDIKSWIKERLIDSFICQEGVNEEEIELCKKYGCEFILFPGYRDPKPTNPKSVADGYRKGVDGIAIWDIEPDYPMNWEWIRRAGHKEEMELWDSHNPEHRRVIMKTVGGFDVTEGLQPSVYSGG